MEHAVGHSTGGARSLDRASALPLWAQLEEDLRRRIGAGQFADGFPTETALTGEYDVSRHTVREALRRLSDAGLVVSRQGRGTFIAPRFDQPLGTLYSLFRSIEEQGGEQVSKVRRLEIVTDPDLAERVGLPSGDALVVLERLRLANGVPLAVDTAWIPAAIGRPLLEADFAHTALYDELARRCNVHVDGGEERIAPVVPTPAQRRLLDLPAGWGAFFLERLGSAGGRPVEYRETIVRGDRYRFVASWSGTQRYRLDLVPDTA